ncbi:MAG: LPS export ABC transporter periplasmic protein LptC [Bacteroidales bacterium]|nr:LPS export ABC transporter periplasmic protein LptC [Bacteroidales bacterium]
MLKYFMLFVLACFSTLCFFSCKNDIEKINLFAENLEIPDQSGLNVMVEYTDSGKLQLQFNTPELKRFMHKNNPYYEFPKGIEVFFYDENEQLESIITANYSLYKENTQIWEARDSVVARNIQTGERIDTEQLFWDQPKKLIYSNVFTKIIDSDGVHYGERGFEAAQDLSHYKLIGGSGTVRVKDEGQ